MSLWRRALVTLGVIAIIAGIVFTGVGIYRAGGVAVIPPGSSPMNLSHGSIEGRRLEGRSWKLSYDRIETSPDGSIAQMDGVHDAVMYRDGKPFVKLRARHVVLNTVTKDVSISGQVTIDTLGNDPRSFTTDAATWSNATQKLTLPHPSTMRAGDEKLHVASADIDFRSGDVKLGAISGAFSL